MTDRISALDDGYTAGDLSIFPETYDDFETLYRATNNSKVLLKQTLTYNGTAVIVESTAGFPDNGLIRVGSVEGPGQYELIAYSQKTANAFLRLQRGFAGSRQSTWAAKENYITNAVVADHHNAIKDAVINIEHDLGVKVDPEPESLNGILKKQEIRFLTPKPLFRASLVKGPPPLTVRFQNFTTGHIVRNFWDFGDGSTELAKNPVHTYYNEGKYTVKLNVITSTGGQAVVTKKEYITVDSEEAIPFIYVDSVTDPYSVETASRLTLENPSDPKEAKEFLFVDQTDGEIIERNWVFGDGETHTELDPDVHWVKHTYAHPSSTTGHFVTCLIVFSNSRLKRVELPEGLVVL